MALIMEHRPRYHQPWWVKIPENPKIPTEDWTPGQRPIDQVHLALDQVTVVRRYDGNHYWTHALPSGISRPLYQIYKHEATNWSREIRPDIDEWMRTRVSENCAYRELTVDCWMGTFYLSHRWRLLWKEDLVLFKLTWG